MGVSSSLGTTWKFLIERDVKQVSCLWGRCSMKAKRLMESHIPTYTHAYKHTHIHTDIHTHTHTYLHTDIHMRCYQIADRFISDKERLGARDAVRKRSRGMKDSKKYMNHERRREKVMENQKKHCCMRDADVFLTCSLLSVATSSGDVATISFPVFL